MFEPTASKKNHENAYTSVLGDGLLHGFLAKIECRLVAWVSLALFGRHWTLLILALIEAWARGGYSLGCQSVPCYYSNATASSSIAVVHEMCVAAYSKFKMRPQEKTA